MTGREVNLNRMLSQPGWIVPDEHLPTGSYKVICHTKETLITRIPNGNYYWNGSYWVTPGGTPAKSIIDAVQSAEE